MVTVPPLPATKLPKLKVVALVMVKGCTTTAEAVNDPEAVACAQEMQGVSAARLTARLNKWDLKMTGESDWAMVQMSIKMTIVVNLATVSHHMNSPTMPPNLYEIYNIGSVAAMLDKLDKDRSKALLT